MSVVSRRDFQNRLKLGEAFLDCSEEYATEYCEKKVAKFSGEKDAMKAEEETILGAAGDEFPPGGGVAGGFDSEFPVADPYAGVPRSEIGLPPLTEAEQEAVAREADRIADEESRRDS